MTTEGGDGGELEAVTDPFFAKAIATLPPVGSDELPSAEHQAAVVTLAEKFLREVTSGRSSQRLREIADLFEAHPLLGLEVVDEAFVVHKNRSGLWGNAAAQAGDPAFVVIGTAFNRLSQVVDQQRGGRHRSSTTPTVKGGGLRPQPSPVVPSPSASYLPLILALKDLRIRYFNSQLDSPGEFSRNTCLVRGETALPSGTETHRLEWSLRAPSGPLPEDPLAAMMLMELGRWPADTLLAVRGIMAFGPGNDALARQCALHALRLNQDCTLALQLLDLLEQKVDPRIPARDVATEVKQVLRQVGTTAVAAAAAESPPRRRPWWRIW